MAAVVLWGYYGGKEIEGELGRGKLESLALFLAIGNFHIVANSY
jgi:hypothetical protein